MIAHMLALARPALRPTLRLGSAALGLALSIAFGARSAAAGGWPQPQTPDHLLGTAAYNNQIAHVARYRGIALQPGTGCAVLDCERLGASAWVWIAGQWTGPHRIVDCTAAHHRPLWRQWARVVDLPRPLWDRLRLPLAPVPALVTFTEPRHFWY